MALVLFTILSSAAVSAAAQDGDVADGETATELLTDGLDAVADHAEDSARRLFNKLISAFPDSPEAVRARQALGQIDNGGPDAEALAAMHAENVDRTAQYRHALLLEVGDRVFFAENSASVGGRARNVIENQARWLKARPYLTVTIVGRSDDGGTAQSGRLLSQNRAQAVRDRLIAAGIEQQRIRIEATGSEGRLATCRAPICQAQNRTAEVSINEIGTTGRLDPNIAATGGMAKTSMGVELDLER